MAVKQEDGWIEDIAGALCDPIIVYPGAGWERDLPPDLKKRLPLDRLAHNMLCLQGKTSRDECCDLEALLYLYPASMAMPMPDMWTRVYLYLGTRAMGRVAPEDFQKEHSRLSDGDMDELAKLKRWIQQKKVDARRARMKGERASPGPAGPAAPTEQAVAYKLF